MESRLQAARRPTSSSVGEVQTPDRLKPGLRAKPELLTSLGRSGAHAAAQRPCRGQSEC